MQSFRLSSIISYEEYSLDLAISVYGIHGLT